MTTNVDRWARTHTLNRYQTSGFFKPKKGEQAMRVCSWMHKITEGDHKLGRYDSTDPAEAVGRTVEEFFLPFRKHFQPKVQTCGMIKRADGKMVGDCNICDQAQDMRKMKGKENADAARKWEASIQNTIQIVCLDEPVLKIITWDAPQTVIDWLIEKLQSRKYVGEQLFGLKDGLDFLVTFNPDTKDNKKKYGFDFMDRGKGAGDLTKVEVGGEIEDLHVQHKYVPEAFASYLPPEPESKTKGEEKAPEILSKEGPKSKATTAAEAAKEPEEPKKRRTRKAPEPEVAKNGKLDVGDAVTFKDTETGKSYDGKITDITPDGWYGIECELGVVEVEPKEVSAK